MLAVQLKYSQRRALPDDAVHAARVRAHQHHAALHGPRAAHRRLVLGAYAGPRARRRQPEELHAALQPVAHGVQEDRAVLGPAPGREVRVVHRPAVPLRMLGELGERCGEVRVGDVHASQHVRHVAAVACPQ
eukprot:CAMPEP_0198516882 /NCGR_PEP_ID=MMETSP1462-20131121/18183_1 /TAXON_ID=1333877 /ORGANISM="Brandtodinium nutriculum, Strain RCC3387" /LENGTH=131 /DNA_ID=CAMNT_0044246419 /DNA_START=111 /DNA_END=503 /DNA_ORIENTATION=-